MGRDYPRPTAGLRADARSGQSEIGLTGNHGIQKKGKILLLNK